MNKINNEQKHLIKINNREERIHLFGRRCPPPKQPAQCLHVPYSFVLLVFPTQTVTSP